VVRYALGPGGVGLINVDSLDGAAQGAGELLFRGEAFVLGLAADGVVENEDFGGAGTVGMGKYFPSFCRIGLTFSSTALQSLDNRQL
jgi:hypothetical protein